MFFELLKTLFTGRAKSHATSLNGDYTGQEDLVHHPSSPSTQSRVVKLPVLVAQEVQEYEDFWKWSKNQKGFKEFLRPYNDGTVYVLFARDKDVDKALKKYPGHHTLTPGTLIVGNEEGSTDSTGAIIKILPELVIREPRTRKKSSPL